MHTKILSLGIFASLTLISCSNQQIVAGTSQSASVNTTTTNSTVSTGSNGEQTRHVQTKLPNAVNLNQSTETTSNAGTVIGLEE